jgi:hypothetical protein
MHLGSLRFLDAQRCNFQSFFRPESSSFLLAEAIGDNRLESKLMDSCRLAPQLDGEMVDGFG